MKQTFKFKTNLNCGNCIARVTTSMNAIDGITEWDVDTNNPDKILTVVSEKDNAQEVIDAVYKMGFDIERI